MCKEVPVKQFGMIFIAIFAILTAVVTEMLYGAPANKSGQSGASGSLLWAGNCNRCHNSPSPSEFSGMQWEMIVLDMRGKAGLTGEDAGKILSFLKSSGSGK
jgi:hypothetical protein